MGIKTRASGARTRFPDGFRIMQGRREYVTYVEHSSVRVWYSDVARYYESHFHSAVEIIVPLKGEVCYNLLDGSYRVQAGEVLIVPPNCSHDLNMGENCSRYLLLFEPTSIFSMVKASSASGTPSISPPPRRSHLRYARCFCRRWSATSAARRCGTRCATPTSCRCMCSSGRIT